MAQIQPFQLEPEYSSDEDIPNNEEEEEEGVLVSEFSSWSQVKKYVVVFVRTLHGYVITEGMPLL